MTKWWPKIVLTVCVVGIGSAILVWLEVYALPVIPGVESGVRRIVNENPALQPLLDRAASDGVLTMSEADAIIAAAEKLALRRK